MKGGLLGMLCAVLTFVAGCALTTESTTNVPPSEPMQTAISEVTEQPGSKVPEMPDVTPATQETAPPADEPHDTQGEPAAAATAQVLAMRIDETPVNVTWEDCESVRVLMDLAANGPVTVNAHQYGSFEQVGQLPEGVVRNDTRQATQSGDIMLYQGNSICVFFGQNTWEYTKLGHIEGMNEAALTALLDKEQTTITFELPLAD